MIKVHELEFPLHLMTMIKVIIVKEKTSGRKSYLSMKKDPNHNILRSLYNRIENRRSRYVALLKLRFSRRTSPRFAFYKNVTGLIEMTGTSTDVAKETPEMTKIMESVRNELAVATKMELINVRKKRKVNDEPTSNDGCFMDSHFLLL